jgi:hypothetical protein
VACKLKQVFDFFDTFFIVMGKKWQQLSFLHVYHHITIFLFYWLNANIGADSLPPPPLPPSLSLFFLSLSLSITLLTQMWHCRLRR